jgi:hypothetical protein
MNPAWPERIGFGQAEAHSKMAESFPTEMEQGFWPRTEIAPDASRRALFLAVSPLRKGETVE